MSADGTMTVDLPSGSSTDDLLYLHVSTEAADEPLAVTAEGFTLLGITGDTERWDVHLYRLVDGSEDPEITVVNLESQNHARVSCLLFTDNDATTPMVAGTSGVFTGRAEDVDPVEDITAVVTTVNASQVLLGFVTYNDMTPSAGGAQVVSGTVDSRVVLLDDDSVSIWIAEAATAGSQGPWQVDRSNEQTGSIWAVGGSWFTVIVQPAVPGTPATVVDFTTDFGPPTVTAVGMAPPPVTLVGPDGEEVVIQEATQEDQQDAIDAQRAIWAEQSIVPDFVDSAYGWISYLTLVDVSGETDVVKELVHEWKEALPALQRIAIHLGRI